MTPWISFDKIVLQTSGTIYSCVSYAVLLQGTMELQLEQDFVMHEEITTTNNCLHDEVRIFVGVSVLRVNGALVYCIKVGIAKVGDAKVTTECYSNVYFSPGILYRK